MADTGIRPSTGSLILAQGVRIVTPLAGVLVLTGTLASIFGLSPSITPSPGTLVVATGAPTPVKTGIITPSTGSLAIQGAPGGGLSPGTGSLTAAGVAPDLSRGTALAPNQGALTLTMGQPFIPGTASLAFSGQTPVVNAPKFLTPGTAALALVGRLAGGNFVTPGTGSLLFGESVDLRPPTGALALTGAAPSLLTNAIRTPTPAGLVLTGGDPSIGRSPVTPGTAALVLTGSPGQVSRSVTVNTGSLILQGNAPTLAPNTVITPPAAGLVLTGLKPDVATHAIMPVTGALAIAGSLPGIPQSITPGTGTLLVLGEPLGGIATVLTPLVASLSLVGQQPQAAQPATLTVASGGLALIGAAPGVQVSTLVSLTPDTGSLALTGRMLILSLSIAPPAAQLDLVGQDGLIRGPILTPATGALLVTGQVPSWAIDSTSRIVVTSTGALVLSGYVPGGEAVNPHLVFLAPPRSAIVSVARGSTGGLLGVVAKQPIETFRLGVDFERWLTGTEIVATAVGTATDSTGASSSGTVLNGVASIDGPEVTIRCQGGTAASQHVVQLQVSTSGGNVYEGELGLSVESQTLVGAFAKEPGENFVIAVDFRAWMTPGDILASASASAVDAAGLASSSSVLSGNPGLTATLAAIRVSGGLDGSTHLVRLVATTAQGNVLAADVSMAVEET